MGLRRAKIKQTKDHRALMLRLNEEENKPPTRDQLVEALRNLRKEIAKTEADFKRLTEGEKDAEAASTLVKMRELMRAERLLSGRLGGDQYASVLLGEPLKKTPELGEFLEATEVSSTDKEIIDAMKELQNEMEKIRTRFSEVKKLMAGIEGNVEHAEDYAKYLKELWRLEAEWGEGQKRTMSLVEALER